MLAIKKADPQAISDIEMQGRKAVKYPFRDLEPGDSFFVSLRDEFHSARTLASRRSRNGKKFIARIDGEELRVSRLS